MWNSTLYKPGVCHTTHYIERGLAGMIRTLCGVHINYTQYFNSDDITGDQFITTNATKAPSAVTCEGCISNPLFPMIVLDDLGI